MIQLAGENDTKSFTAWQQGFNFTFMYLSYWNEQNKDAERCQPCTCKYD